LRKQQIKTFTTQISLKISTGIGSEDKATLAAVPTSRPQYTNSSSHLESNSSSMRKEAEEVTCANTTPQPQPPRNNANAKHKQPQAVPTNLRTLNETQQQIE
jgi:hypothetical protein